MVVECCGSSLDHLKRGGLRTPIDERSVQFRLNGPDVLQPVLKDHILADTPHKGHGGVCVHIYESRNRYLACAVQSLYSRGCLPVLFGVRRYPLDQSVSDCDVNLTFVQSNIPK